MRSDMNAEEFLRRPYTRVLRRDEDGDYVARVAELPGCVADGETPEAALARLDEMQRLWFEDAIASGDALPEPEPDDDELPSGKWLQRVPRSLHRAVVQLAARENVSLNQLVTTLIAEAVGREKARESVGSAVVKAVRDVFSSNRGEAHPDALDLVFGSRQRMKPKCHWIMHVDPDWTTGEYTGLFLRQLTGDPADQVLGRNEVVIYGGGTPGISAVPKGRAAHRGWTYLEQRER
jgi:antitoxin HicB